MKIDRLTACDLAPGKDFGTGDATLSHLAQTLDKAIFLDRVTLFRRKENTQQIFHPRLDEPKLGILRGAQS